MQLNIPDAFLVRDCDNCGTRHAPVRDCVKPLKFDAGGIVYRIDGRGTQDSTVQLSAHGTVVDIEQYATGNRYFVVWSDYEPRWHAEEELTS